MTSSSISQVKIMFVEYDPTIFKFHIILSLVLLEMVLEFLSKHNFPMLDIDSHGVLLCDT